MMETLHGSAGYIDIDDVDAYPEAMGQWDLEMRQISPGKFHGRTEYVEVAGMLLYREHWSRRSITNATTPADSFLFGCSRSSQSQIDWCGKYLQNNLLASCHPGTDINCVTPDMNEHVVLEIPRHMMEKIVPEEDAATQLALNRHIKTNAERGAQFVQMIDQTISSYMPQAESMNDERVCRSIVMQVMDQLTDLVLHDSSSLGDTSKRTYDIALDRALEFTHSQHAPVTLTEIAKATGLMPRTLQRAFQKKFNISPLKYLRISRMNAAHKALRTADRSSATVTDIALEWGFKELGRFACEYRQLFGDSPATTLARNSGPPARDMYSVIHK